jgi:hypothetical protein
MVVESDEEEEEVVDADDNTQGPSETELGSTTDKSLDDQWLGEVEEDEKDIKMKSPSPEIQPAQGSSRSAGGFARGNKAKSSIADAQRGPPAPLSAKGQVRFFATSTNPNSIGLAGTPNMVFFVLLFDSLSSLLPALAPRFPLLAGMCSILMFGFFNLVISS